MDIKVLKKYNLVKGTGAKQQIGVPYKTKKGYKIRWVETPNDGQVAFIEDYVNTQPVPKVSTSKKK